MLLMVLLAPWAVAQQSLPYSYGFEDNDLSADGWTNVSGSIGSNARTGSYGFDFNYNISSDAYLMSPVLTGGTNGVNVSFYAKARSSSYLDHFQIGYTTDATVTDPSAFTYGSLITSTTSWEEYTAECPAGTVRVAIKYDTDNYNDGWDLYLDDFTFEAGASCKTPTGLTATNLTTESATLGWTAPDPAPSNGYNVRYRTALIDNPFYFDDFETNTLTGWTVYTDGEAPESQGWYTYDPTNGLDYSAHSGSYCASAWSWTNNTAYNADNWLISPEVPLTGFLRFYVRTNAGFPDEYEVLLSTTGTDEADFTVELQAMAPAPTTGAWEAVTISLKSYSGNGYIAIHHVSEDMNYLLIDDFGIFDEPTPAGAWVNKTTSTNSLNISGLTVETTYDFEVQSNCGGETSEWASAQFTTNSNCMPVADLAVSDATTTTISLTWTDQNGGAASYIITDGDDNAVTVTNLTTTGCTVINLTANTAYTFKVTADCGSTAETIQARTDCDALATLPYEEGFEASSVNIYCWDLDDFGRVNNSTYAHTGNVALFSQTTSVGYAILPATATNISDLMLNFWWSNYYSGYNLGYLEVGYITDINDYTTFVEVETIDMSSSSATYTQTNDFVFTGAPAGARIAFSYTPGSSGSLVLIDDLTLDVAPSCMKPTDLAVDGGLQAVVSWTGTAESFDIAFSDDPTANPEDVIVGSSTTNSFNLYEEVTLAEGDYTVWVRANCGSNGYSEWVSTEFHLGYCSPNITSHDGNGITQVTFGSGTEVVNNGDGTTSIPASAPYYGDYSSMIGAIPAGVASTIAITTSTSSYPYTFVIWVDLDNSLSFEDEEILYVGKAASGSGTLNAEITIPATQALGDYRMRIYGADSYFTDFYNNGTPDYTKPHDPCADGTWRHANDYTVRVTEAPACLAPSGLGADNITANTADLSWTANSGEKAWTVYYKKTSESKYDDKAVSAVPYTLEGLEAASDYEYYVVANCSSSEESDPSSLYYFSTECDLIKITDSNHYTQDFESPVVTSVYNSTTGLEVPICWENPYTTGSSAAGQPHLVKTGASYNYSTNQVLLFYGSGYNYVTMPEFSNDLNELQITFKWATESNSNGTLTLGYITDGDVNYNTFTEIAGASYTASSSSYHTMLQADPVYLNTLPSTAKRLAFRWYCTNQLACNIDDLEVSLMPSCYPLGTLSYGNLASETVDLYWSLVDATQDAWQVCINDDEANLIDITEADVTVEGDNRTYSLGGLTPETDYTVKVRANCGGSDFSEWSNTISFTTLAACATPTGLTADDFTQNTALLTWTGSSDVAAYTVEYRTAAGLQTHYFEGFESGQGDWTMVSCASGSGVSTTASYVHTGNAAFSFQYNTNPPQYLISPALSGITSGMVLEFWYKNSSTSWTETFQVGFSSTDNDVDSFAWEDEISASDGQWHSYSVTVPASTLYLCFKYTANDKLRLCIDDITIGTVVSAGSWQTADNNVTDWHCTIEGLTASTKYDARVYANCESDPDTHSAMTTFTTLAEHNIVFPVDGNWAAGNFEPAGAPTIDDDVIIRADATIPGGTNAYANDITFEGNSVITVAAGATLTINGNVINGGSDKIIVEDGGQLIHENSAVSATLRMGVEAYNSKGGDGWYFIATPVSSISTSTVAQGTYDLFKYNEPNAYWYSNTGSNSFSYLYRNTGYLYANAEPKTFDFAGQMQSTKTVVSVNLSYTTSATHDLKGFNLLGNPFSCNVGSGVMKIGSTVVTQYYGINEEQTDLAIKNLATAPIQPCEGFMIQAEDAGLSLTFNSTAKDENDNKGYILISAGNESYSDDAYINIANGNTLRKLNIGNSLQVYVMNNGKDYAAARVEELAGSIPVSFKAIEAGAYTITINANEIEASTMILIDKLTGEEVDLLETSSYIFKSETDDPEERFLLIFDFNSYAGVDENYGSDIFAYQSGDEIYVTGEGTLQVYDVMGRFVASYEVSGSKRISASQFTTGVYIFRMVGTEVMTQKIVVR